MAAAGLYIHIPFCRRKCAYCDFCSFPGLDALHDTYPSAVLREAVNQGPAWADTVFDTVYVGGGTPTVLPATSLAGLLRGTREALGVACEAEITVEANPGTVDASALSALREAGYNRLSLGVQSLQDAELAFLGRVHRAAEAIEAFRAARRAGFDNISLDLMFGLPRQQLSDWQRSLEGALALGPEHLSLYALTVEEGTPLAEWIAGGAVPVPDDEDAADMYEWAEDRLAGAGYAHYEISNWARVSPGDEGRAAPVLACQHNLKYWRNEPYLGLGVAAHSYDGQRRCANVEDPGEYLARLERDQDATAFCEALDRQGQIAETMMLGLRLSAGVDRADFGARFGVTLEEVYGREVETLVRQGLLASDARGIRLTRRGRLLGNRVFAAFLR